MSFIDQTTIRGGTDGTQIGNSGDALNGNLTKVGSSSITLGQKTSANSVPVVLPSDQTVTVNTTQFSVVNALQATNYDLNAAAYSATSALSNDFVLDTINFKFSTSQSRTITVTRADGSILYQDTNTSTNVVLERIDEAMNGGDNFTIAVTQTGGACLMTLVATIFIGQNTLGANPSLGESTADIGNVGITDGPHQDAFGRLRVSEPYNLIDTQFQYNLQPLVWDSTSLTSATGSVTHLPNQSSAELSLGTTSGHRTVLQTKQYLRYQPGKSQLTLMTGVLGSGVSNLTKRIGYYDDNDGIFFGKDSTGTLVCRRTSTTGSVVNNTVYQTSWNLDVMDGTGSISNPSGVLLDTTKTQIFVIDLQWLSVGRVRVGFEIGGEIIYVHEFLNANVLTVPYMKTANLPLRYEMVNTGATAGTNTMQAICSTVMSEGGRQASGVIVSANTGISGIAGVGTTGAPIISIRPKSTFNSITNRGIIRPIHIDALSSGDLLWELYYNPTLTGSPSWVSANANSIVEYDISATGWSGGLLVASGFKGTGSGIVQSDFDLERVVLSLDAAGTTADIFTLVVKSISGSINVKGAINWREEY